jgi:hypothetical protein
MSDALNNDENIGKADVKIGANWQQGGCSVMKRATDSEQNQACNWTHWIKVNLGFIEGGAIKTGGATGNIQTKTVEAKQSQFAFSFAVLLSAVVGIGVIVSMLHWKAADSKTQIVSLDTPQQYIESPQGAPGNTQAYPYKIRDLLIQAASKLNIPVDKIDFEKSGIENVDVHPLGANRHTESYTMSLDSVNLVLACQGDSWPGAGSNSRGYLTIFVKLSIIS